MEAIIELIVSLGVPGLCHFICKVLTVKVVLEKSVEVKALQRQTCLFSIRNSSQEKDAQLLLLRSLEWLAETYAHNLTRGVLITKF